MTPCVYGQHYMEIRMPPGRASLQPSGYYNGPAVADYGIWYNLVAAFAQHLVQRYGDDAPQFYEVRKTVLFVRFYILMIILPRQARDKHRESTQKQTVSQVWNEMWGVAFPNPYMVRKNINNY